MASPTVRDSKRFQLKVFFVDALKPQLGVFPLSFPLKKRENSSASARSFSQFTDYFNFTPHFLHFYALFSCSFQFHCRFRFWIGNC